MEIGEKIRLRRAKLKMTQVDLARKAGIKQPTISAIENGVNKPAIDTIILIAHALNCDVSDLVDQAAPAPAVSDPAFANLLSIFNQLNSAGRSFLLQQAESILMQPAFRKEGSIYSAG